MTYPAPDVVPYDEWFDPNYKYDPDEEMDLAPSSVEPQDEEEENVHEKMYKIAFKYEASMKIREGETVPFSRQMSSDSKDEG